jgi:phosphate:Na+ symporter
MERPQRGFDCAARELLGMGQRIEQMLTAVEPLYDTWNETGATAIRAQGSGLRAQDKAIKQTPLNIKLYLARLGKNGLDEDLGQRSMELALVSTNLAAASDAITRLMLDLAKRLHTKGVHFSPKGREEIRNFSDRVHSNVQLALNVMMNQDPAEARALVAAIEKVRMV